MRILKLKECRIEKIDDSIGELVHLRYLDLSNTNINSLPKSIGKLYHLQTLKLYNCHLLKKFPKAMRNLISLRSCKSSKSIPANIMGQLTSLRTLASFKVGREIGNQIEELGHLKHLGGKLHIFNLENVGSKEDAIKADLSGKKNLYLIAFNWSKYNEGANRNDKDILEGLQPPGDVKTLRINNFSGDNFPEWAMKMAIGIGGKWTPLDKLVSIALSGCSNCLSLPTLEHLPHLQELELTDMGNLTYLKSSSGQCDDVTGLVKPLSPSLRMLRLWGMKKLEKWIDGETNSSTMISPVLERLVIDTSPKISLLDECHPHPLVSLKIWGCGNLVSIKSIQGLTSLESLVVFSCPSLLGITNLPNQCHSLKTLQITHCDKLASLPHEIFDSFAFLNKLDLGPFSEEFDSFPSLQGIEKLSFHLHSLKLIGRDHWESIPGEIQHLTSLIDLRIVGFGIRDLPMWLTNMPSIRVMKFLYCFELDKETVKRGAPLEANDVRLNRAIVM